MCTWKSHKADRRCSKPATTAWCSRCSSCCCPMTCLSTPSPSSSEWLLSSSWCFSCEYGRQAGEPNPECQLWLSHLSIFKVISVSRSLCCREVWGDSHREERISRRPLELRATLKSSHNPHLATLVLCVYSIQDIAILFNIIIIFLMFFNTFVFQAGLVNLLFHKFKGTIILTSVYLALSISLHVWVMVRVKALNSYIFNF